MRLEMLWGWKYYLPYQAGLLKPMSTDPFILLKFLGNRLQSHNTVATNLVFSLPITPSLKIHSLFMHSFSKYFLSVYYVLRHSAKVW